MFFWLRAGLGLFLILGIAPVFAGSLEEIRERGKLIVGICISDTPLAYRDETGQLAGFELDLCRKLAEQLFNTPSVEWKILTTTERLSALENGTVDIVLGNLTVTAARARAIDFSVDYYRPRQLVAVQITDPARKLSDLDQAKIAVLQNSSSIAGLQLLLPKATVVEVPNYLTAQMLVQQGTVRGFSADNTTLLSLLKQNSNLRTLDTPLQGYVLAAGLPKGLASENFRVWVDQQLTQLRKQNWLTATLDKWGLKV